MIEDRFPVPIHLGVTPVPIPNTTVKTQTAEGTTLVTMWKNRWVPDFMTGFTGRRRIQMIESFGG